MSGNWLTFANLLGLVGSVIINVWLFLATRSDGRWKSITRQVETTDRRLVASHSATERRVSVLETRVDAMPSQEDLMKIHAKLGHIDRSVGALDERSNSTLVAVRRIEGYLMGTKR